MPRGIVANYCMKISYVETSPDCDARLEISENISNFRALRRNGEADRTAPIGISAPQPASNRAGNRPSGSVRPASDNKTYRTPTATYPPLDWFWPYVARLDRADLTNQRDSIPRRVATPGRGQIDRR